MSDLVHALPLPAGKPLAPLARRLTGGARARLDDLLLALNAMAGHKLRASLTLLGIVIGVFTVVSMMALVTGLQNSIENGMGGLGADVFQLQKWPSGFHFGNDPAIAKRHNLTLQQALALKDALPQARQVGAEMWENGKEVATTENSVQGCQVAGGTAEFFTNNSLPIGRGRGFYENEALSAARVIVLGAGVIDALFPEGDAVGKRVRLGRLELEVIGSMERQGGNPFGGNPDKMATIPIGLFLELYGTSRSVNITVMAQPGQVRKLQDPAIAAFRRIRGLTAEQPDDFDMFTNDSVREQFDQMAMMVKIFSACVCALSLVVGGIGVMNIMLVAVVERTREIGLRKALGARKARILSQFVFEAVVLSLIGGVLGVLLGYVASAMVRFGARMPTEVPLWSVVLSLVVSCGIGLVFGIYPAYRAARLDPAVALRDE
jgi:putative ABC transport system permease protein